ncbi:Crp/Fnr family transcriptional regulator [Paraurantiacibacter namhicola]|uniref:Nitrogen fixation regulation protein FixK n=1 Tax=Paraurantiacibacter namhicola TaxID=645517 RepID=A0A1C7D7K4_9SPHN|nr:Crp/Fnr family transcriptional regulator [Paraurantiacibacter namhicola]ANU07425.1 Nitrogen fixation regulation protein FixK [Paraurantiacibacter namhicola]
MALDCAHCPVRESAACAVLTEEERGALARAGRRQTLQKGETLFAAGDDAAGFATLTSGALKVTSFDEAGQERILALVHPAGFVGEMFAPFARHDVVALAPSELCIFAARDIEAAIDAHPALAKALLRRSQEDLHASRHLLAISNPAASVKSRVAAFLYSMAETASHSPCHPATQFDLPLTRGEMAGLLGTTIESVSRSLTALERDGLVTRNGARGISLSDPARLLDAA